MILLTQNDVGDCLGLLMVGEILPLSFVTNQQPNGEKT